MNRLYTLLIGLMIFSSCDKLPELEELKAESDSLLGTWQPIKDVSVCSTGKESVFDYDDCLKQGRYVFEAHNNPDLETDGTITIIEKNLDDNECKTTYDVKGTWSLNENVFSSTTDGKTNNPTFFELTAKQLRIGYYDDDPNDSCDGGNLPSHYYTEFIRLE